MTMCALQVVKNTALVEVPATAAWDCHYRMKRGWSCRPWSPLRRKYRGGCKK